MSLIHSETMQNLKTADFTMLPYEVATILPTSDYIGKQAYLSFLFIHDVCEVIFENNTIKVFPGNIIMLRSMTDYQINFLTVPIDSQPQNKELSTLNTKNLTSFLLNIDKKLFDTHHLSMLSDCPIFYDLLRLEEEKNEYLFFDCNELNVIQNYAALLLYECSYADATNEKSIKNALILFLTRLHKLHYRHLVISESSMMPNYPIGSFLKYMTEHYNDVTLVSMAEHFNFHPSYLSSLFKSLSGFTFSEKLLMIRLEQAKRLLITTNLSIQSIVDLIGFKEKSYFHKCFKKYYHTTPSKYRKEHSPEYEKKYK